MRDNLGLSRELHAIDEVPASFTNVKFVTVSTCDGVDNIARGAGEVRSDVNSVHWANNVSFTRNITTGVAVTSITFDSMRVMGLLFSYISNKYKHPMCDVTMTS